MNLHHRAFTLVELLVVITIISLLVAILLPVLAAARGQAQQIRMATGLREMMHGYTLYHGEHRGWLLWGYTPTMVNGVPVIVNDPTTGFSFGLPVADRYPWRLSNYVGNLWQIIHQHGPRPQVPLPGDSPAVALDRAYRLSIHPSFGINSVYVGGHAGPIFKGFVGPNSDRPNLGSHAVFRDVEVLRPSALIVFAETQARNAPFTDPQAGLHLVMPPRAGGQRWAVHGDRFELTSSMVTGLPQGRFTRAAPVAFFDGHVQAMTPGQLDDMRWWSNSAQSSIDDPIP